MVKAYDGHAFVDFVDRHQEAVSCHASFGEGFALREFRDGDHVADCAAEAAAVELEGSFGESFCGHF